jgi:hypothetical protein
MPDRLTAQGWLELLKMQIRHGLDEVLLPPIRI